MGRGSYYFSVNELLAICAVEKVNVVVFKSGGNRLEYAGSTIRGDGPVIVQS